MNASSEQELQEVVGEQFSVLNDCGFVKPFTGVKIEDKADIVQSICLHHVILRSKAEIDQLTEGLRSCGVLDEIRQNRDLTRSFFTIDGNPEKLTAGMLW
jgi:hypothetical protein